MSTRVPIVVVMGATGTGKSKLALQLAKKFNGEIISADSMQVYRGLDIASNKVTRAEKAEMPHHMLDICRPMDRFSVMDFRHRTLPIIDDILKRHKLPIIVGGTDYYIESILWESLTSGPPIEADELVDKHYHVINAPELINKWQTFEASVRPKLNEEISSEVNSNRQSSELAIAPITVHMVTRLSDMMERSVGEFREGVQSIADELNVNTSMYLQTFYRLPGSGRADQTAEENQQCQPQSQSFNFVDAELALLNYYLHACLQKLVGKLVENNDDNWRPDEMCRELVSQCWDCPAVATVINEALISSVDFTHLLKRICELSTSHSLLAKCHESMSVVFDNLKAVTEIRIERLKLLRISDDVSMIDYMNDKLYNELKLVDSKSTELIHPNNRRKIIRALQVYFQEGIPFSKFLEEQHHQEGGDGMFPPMRFPDACLLWLTCDQDILTKRLNERVDEMMKDGLIEELEKFHEDYNVDRLKNNLKADYTKGIFQSIGLKEFHKYLMLSPEEKCSREGRKALQSGIHYLKAATVRYSKIQYRRVSNRYICIPSERNVPPIFELDCSNLEQWNERVENIAFDIVDAYLRGQDLKKLKHAPVEIEEPDTSRFEDGKFTCDICHRVFIGKYQWQAHYTSKGHRKQLYQIKQLVEMFKRAATELLSLDKDDVQSVLLATVHGKNEDVFKCLSLFPYFSGWSEKSMKECCILSSIKRFLQNTLILDCADKTHSYTYFILDGFCEVVQKFVLQSRNKSSVEKVFGIHPNQNAEDSDSIIVFVKIRDFGPGECFGLGEDLSNRWIISSTPIRCLVIPRDFLLQHNENNVWPRARQRISASFPSAKQIYQSIRQQVKWDRFKKQYSEFLLVNRNFTSGTRLQDVPRYWRSNIDVPKALL